MPLYRIQQIFPSVFLGIWKIEESPEELKAQQSLTIPEELYFSGIKNEVRKKHWLSYRLILKNMPGAKGPFFYDEYGKPFLREPKNYVSISHSGIFSVLIFSTARPVGIDIEKMTTRIERIREKFLSQAELNEIGKINQLEKLYVYWGAKETLYKIHGKPDVDFIHDIAIKPFEYTMTGNCFARMITANLSSDFELFYEEIEGYMLVYSIKSKR